MSLTVEKIDSGTVIDHIPAGKSLKVIKILGLTEEKNHNRVAMIMNVPSKKMGRKDIVKIEGVILPDVIVKKLSLIAPNATINKIMNGSIESKTTLTLEGVMTGAAKCPNPSCVTNSEKAVESKFVTEKNSSLRCYYCERSFASSELV